MSRLAAVARSIEMTTSAQLALRGVANAGRRDQGIQDGYAVAKFGQLARAGDAELIVHRRPDLIARARHVLDVGVPLSTTVTGNYTLHHENPHSLLLGFLLDTNAPHAAGTRFLECFFDLVGEEGRRDLDTVEVRVDKPLGSSGRPDILLVAGDQSVVLVVETKVHADESDGQLSAYRAAALECWPDARHVFVFLTPEGRPPRTGDPDVWRLLSFIRLRDAALRWAVKDGGVSLATRAFLRSWAEEMDHGAVPSGARLNWRVAFDVLRRKDLEALQADMRPGTWRELIRLLHRIEPAIGVFHD